MQVKGTYQTAFWILPVVAVAAALIAACGGSDPTVVREPPTLPTRPPTPTYEPTPIASDEESVMRGAEVYAISCAGCHGEEGQGAGLEVFHPPPPNLGVVSRPELTNGEIRRVLTSASSDHPNPSLDGRPLSEFEIVDVIAYVRSISDEWDDSLNFKCEDCHGVDMSGS